MTERVPCQALKKFNNFLKLTQPLFTFPNLKSDINFSYFAFQASTSPTNNNCTKTYSIYT